MKLYHKIAILLTCAGLFTACTYDEGPSIDDHFLNYRIENIPLTADCPVGVFYYDNGPNGLNGAVYDRLLEEPDPAVGKVGPYVKPLLENYKVGVNEESVTVIQQHVDWCIAGGIDFLILPGVQEDNNQRYPINIEPRFRMFIDLVTGKTGSDNLPAESTAGSVVNLKSLKYILSVNLERVNNNNVRLNNNTLIEHVAPTQKNGEDITRVERFNDLFKKLSDYFADPAYYKVDNKPMVLIFNADRLYSEDSRKLYDDMRAYVKDFSGYDMFLVVEQPSWSPPARYEYFYIKGNVDAVTHKNMYDQSTYNRSLWYPQMIDQNWIYSREFFMNHWNIDYIPTIAPSFNNYVYEGRHYNYPIVEKNEETFRTMCNVAKKNLGEKRIVFINSFNQWQHSTMLEPTDPAYGNGYGTTYLDIVKEQFKK
jgi:hypothetical protein